MNLYDHLQRVHNLTLAGDWSDEQLNDTHAKLHDGGSIFTLTKTTSLQKQDVHVEGTAMKRWGPITVGTFWMLSIVLGVELGLLVALVQSWL